MSLVAAGAVRPHPAASTPAAPMSAGTAGCGGAGMTEVHTYTPTLEDLAHIFGARLLVALPQPR
jgi:hypothetical protein